MVIIFFLDFIQSLLLHNRKAHVRRHKSNFVVPKLIKERKQTNARERELKSNRKTARARTARVNRSGGGGGSREQEREQGSKIFRTITRKKKEKIRIDRKKGGTHKARGE